MAVSADLRDGQHPADGEARNKRNDEPLAPEVVCEYMIYNIYILYTHTVYDIIVDMV